MGPLLQYVSDEHIHSVTEVGDHLAVHFGLSDAECRFAFHGGQPVFRTRVRGVKGHLIKAGLLNQLDIKGKFQITKRGLEAFRSGEKINYEFLRQYPEFIAFWQRGNRGRLRDSTATLHVSTTRQVAPTEILPTNQDEHTPDELLEYAYLALREELVQDLLEQIKLCSSHFFEKLVVDLLVAMGYGGSRKDAAQVVGSSGDEGIDGIIKEDQLGLDNIYVQAKKWDDKKPISRPEIQKFVGALQGHHATKGVFLTTGRFAESAKVYVKNLNCKVVLIDGEQLGQYMIDFNVGVSSRETYEVKKLDTDYFSED